MSARTRVKICCIASVEEARLAVEAGADAVGLVSAMPSGPGPIPDERIAEIAAAVPPPVATVLLTALTDGDAIAEQAARAGVGAIQLVDAVPAGERARVRAALPAVRVLQVVHVRGEGSVDEARRAAEHAHALLLDSGNPTGEVKELGGTGRVHDWDVSRRIVASVDRPVFLAGGLRADNVAAAVAATRPYGIDVCTGVRADGALCPDRLGAFMTAVGASR